MTINPLREMISYVHHIPVNSILWCAVGFVIVIGVIIWVAYYNDPDEYHKVIKKHIERIKKWRAK